MSSSKSTTHRKLAAIMFTDIVGYTRLMGEDETKALELLHQNRELQKKCVEQHHGTWLKEMGDGILTEFPSALDAVLCAKEIQENAGSLREKIRIGIHLGDVTEEEGDVFGDGVNIASRIQSIADPGGIYFSDSVQKAIKSSKQIKHQLLGDIPLKNVDKPVTTFYLKGPNLPVPRKEKLSELHEVHVTQRRKINTYIGVTFIIILIASGLWFWKLRSNDQIKSIAVLPVENLTGDPEVEYFAAGIHATLIDEINRLGDIRVPSRRTSMQYMDGNKSLPEIAQELDVDAVIEASLFEVSEIVRLRVALVDTQPHEQTLWNHEFEPEMKQVLSVYNAIAKRVAEIANIALSEDEKRRLGTSQEVDPEAYLAYLKGINLLYNLTKEDLDNALIHLKFSVEKDPDYAPTYAGLAKVWGGKLQQGILPSNQAEPKLDMWLDKAMELDPDHVEIQYTIATNATWRKYDWELAARTFRRALELDPNHYGVKAYYSHYLQIMHENNIAMTHIEEVIESDPKHPLYRGLYGMSLNFSDQFEKARKIAENNLEKTPNDPLSISSLKSTYHNLKMYDKALEIWKKDFELADDFIAIETLDKGYLEGGYFEALKRLAELMIKRSETTYYTPWRIATMYTRAGMKEEALEYLWKAYEAQDANMPYISCDPIFDFMRDDPSFKELLVLMKLNFD